MAKILETKERTLVQIKYKVLGDQLVLDLEKLEGDVYVPWNSKQETDILLFWGSMENFQNDLKKFLAEENK